MLKPLVSAVALAVISATAPNFAIAQDTANVEAAAPAEASWYGKPFAVSGQDVVSFHEASGPVAGSEEFAATWDNTEWYFSSAENRDEFLADPIRYVPEFGGYCPVALTQGQAKIGTAEHFTIVDEKLYFNFNQATENSFEDNPIGYIAAAKVSF